MEIDVKNKALEYVIDKVFIPNLTAKLQAFLINYEGQLITEIQISNLIGKKVAINKPIVLNIKEEVKSLMDSIKIIYK